jgi:hypothetical protein
MRRVILASITRSSVSGAPVMRERTCQNESGPHLEGGGPLSAMHSWATLWLSSFRDCEPVLG